MLACLPALRNGSVPATAAAITSCWAKPESACPAFTASTFATAPSEVRALITRPAGPQVPAAAQRSTPGGWLISPAISCPSGKYEPPVEPVRIWKEIRDGTVWAPSSAEPITNAAVSTKPISAVHAALRNIMGAIHPIFASGMGQREPRASRNAFVSLCPNILKGLLTRGDASSGQTLFPEKGT